MTYTTPFTGTENPLSESANWNNGLAVGLDWLDMQKGNGPPQMAFAAANQVFSGDECLACLTGTWTPIQTAQATIFVNAADIANNPIASLLCNFTITAHSLTGYRMAIVIGGGIDLYRYDGSKGTFTALLSGLSPLDNSGTGPVVTGSRFQLIHDAAGILTMYEDIGSGFTALTGGSIFDGTYPGGAPGIGSFIGTSPKPLTDTGWSDFTAFDAPTVPFLGIRGQRMMGVIHSQGG